MVADDHRNLGYLTMVYRKQRTSEKEDSLTYPRLRNICDFPYVPDQLRLTPLIRESFKEQWTRFTLIALLLWAILIYKRRLELMPRQ